MKFANFDLFDELVFGATKENVLISQLEIMNSFLGSNMSLGKILSQRWGYFAVNQLGILFKRNQDNFSRKGKRITKLQRTIFGGGEFSEEDSRFVGEALISAVLESTNLEELEKLGIPDRDGLSKLIGNLGLAEKDKFLFVVAEHLQFIEGGALVDELLVSGLRVPNCKFNVNTFWTALHEVKIRTPHHTIRLQVKKHPPLYTFLSHLPMNRTVLVLRV